MSDPAGQGAGPPQQAAEDRFITPEEAAELLKLDASRVRSLLREGRIPGTKPFGKWLVDRAGVERLIDEAWNTRVDEQLAKALNQ